MSVLNTLPTYAMQTTLLPEATCQEIDRKIRNFIWGSKNGERKVHLISWENVCKPKDQGGLGLRSAHELNQAFLMKLTWGMLKKPSKLWVNDAILTTKPGLDTTDADPAPALMPGREYTGPRPTPAPPPKPRRAQAPELEDAPGRMMILSQATKLAPTPARVRLMTLQELRLTPSPDPDPGPNLVPKLGPMQSARSPRPAPAFEDPLRAFLKTWPKQQAEGLAIIDKGPALSQPRAPDRGRGTIEACFEPMTQMARPFGKIPVAMDSLKPQEHSPTNRAEFGEELKEIELGQVLAKHGWSTKEEHSDADLRKPMLGAMIRPPPEPDPRRDG
ncbi:Putative ribonuclease H protein At1g65750 [Linum perenne]